MATVLCAPTRNRATHPTLVVRRNVATAGPYLRRQPAAAKRDSWVRLWLHVCGRTCTASSDATSCTAHGIAASDRERGALPFFFHFVFLFLSIPQMIGGLRLHNVRQRGDSKRTTPMVRTISCLLIQKERLGN